MTEQTDLAERGFVSINALRMEVVTEWVRFVRTADGDGWYEFQAPRSPGVFARQHAATLDNALQEARKRPHDEFALGVPEKS